MISYIALTVLFAAFIYPLILLSFWSIKKEVKIGEVLDFIKTAKLAQSLNTQMIEETDIVVFAPNLIGALTVLLKDYFGILQTSNEITLAFLISHFSLIVLTTIGKAFLRMALNKASILLVGEILINWALIAGSLLFVFQIYEFGSIVGAILSSLLILVVLIFLITYGVFRMLKGAQIYANGSYAAKHKPPQSPVKDKFLVETVTEIEEAIKLAKQGYEKIDEINGKSIYRKQNE